MLRAAVVSGALAVVAVIFGFVAVYFFEEANKASRIAAANEAKARQYLAQAQITQSRSLVKAAEQDRDRSIHEDLAGPRSFAGFQGRDRAALRLRGATNPGQGARRSARTRRDRGPHRSRPGRGGHAGRTPHRHRLGRQRWCGCGTSDSGAEVRQFKGHDGVGGGSGGDAGWTPHRDRLGRQDGAGVGRRHRSRNCSSSTAADAVRGVAVTPDGTRIVTGSDDNIARVWDARSGAELLQFKGHADRILAVAVTPDGRHIVTGSDDNTARVWDANSRSGAASAQGSASRPERGGDAGRNPHHHRLGRQHRAGMGRAAAGPNCSSSRVTPRLGHGRRRDARDGA